MGLSGPIIMLPWFQEIWKSMLPYFVQNLAEDRHPPTSWPFLTHTERWEADRIWQATCLARRSQHRCRLSHWMSQLVIKKVAEWLCSPAPSNFPLNCLEAACIVWQCKTRTMQISYNIETITSRPEKLVEERAESSSGVCSIVSSTWRFW